VLNVNWYVAGAFTGSPLRAGWVPAGTTLCRIAPGRQVHVTVVPALTVRVAGMNWLFATLMAELVGGAAVAVAEKVRGDPLRVPEVAVIVIGPGVLPAVTFTPEIPEASDGTLAAETVPPVAAQATLTPSIPLPKSSDTLACTGAGSGLLIAALWPSPPAGERVLTVAATAVPLKTTGDPAAPLNVAWADWEPDTVPSVQMLLARPFASVTADVGLREPPEAVDQVTVVPEAGVPFSLTTTWSGSGSASPTVPV
jgi:hypothetical protein